MDKRHSLIMTGYSWLLRLYPQSHQELFADEMSQVFADAVAGAAKNGRVFVGLLCLRELRDLPSTLLNEYWQSIQQWFVLRQIEGTKLKSDLPGIVPPGFTAFSDTLFFIRAFNPRIRRLFDVLFALLCIVIASPLLLLLPLLIKLDSAGPIFYQQICLGKNSRPYTMYKFRSMVASQKDRACRNASKPTSHDSRITNVGRWVRKTNLDEFPQLINVLKGEMTIFGPRPRWPN